MEMDSQWLVKMIQFDICALGYTDNVMVLGKSEESGETITTKYIFSSKVSFMLKSGGGGGEWPREL